MQLIIVLETKNKDGSDNYYLRAIRQRFYVDRGTKITSLFMCGKGNYKNMEKKIKAQIKEYGLLGGRCELLGY